MKKQFFLNELQTNFNNINKTYYSLEMKSFFQIFFENIQNFMIQQQIFNALNKNNILNVFLHTLEKFFVTVIMKLIQIC